MGFEEYLWIYLTKDTQLVPRRSTDIVLSPICLFYPQNPAIRMRSNSVIQTKSALQFAQGIFEQNCNEYIVIQIIFNQIIFKLFSICMRIYKIQLQRKATTKITTSFVNNTPRILSQSNLMKTRNLFQWSDDLFTFPFKIWLTFFTFPL